MVAEENGGLVLRLGLGRRAHPLAHFDRDTFSYQSEGKTVSGPSGVTFRDGPDRVADEVTIEVLSIHGADPITRVPPGK